MFCVVDDYTRECLVLVTDTTLSGVWIVGELDTIAAVRGYPSGVASDKGTELTSKACLRCERWPGRRNDA
jgi:putative transposase